MAILTDVPHFDLPFRLDGLGHAMVVEQDSIDDVSNCVEAVIRTIIGDRVELPGFGIDNPVFTNQPISASGIMAAVLDQEPRAHLLLTQAPDKFDYLIAKVLVEVSTKEENNV